MDQRVFYKKAAQYPAFGFTEMLHKVSTVKRERFFANKPNSLRSLGERRIPET
jgi:hypothetical protein